ncbi:MAG: DUF523 domain-containing protein [Myxococcaceae bacterium]|nr:MAG: DUF523 domain-containing protein [Myxococcaceae bacterium]
MVLVSACLLGEACRYDGRAQRSERVLAALEGKSVVPICPEAAAGMGIPRPPVDLSGGTGVDVWALLKEKSPSCGSQRVYDTGVLRPGEGITTALLRADGRTVVSDEDL